MTFKDAYERLRAGKGSIRCGEVVSVLESMGFAVKRNSTATHHTYNHPALIEFQGSNFACPHRAGDPVKKSYVSNILRVLRQYESELVEYLGALQ